MRIYAIFQENSEINQGYSNTTIQVKNNCENISKPREIVPVEVEYKAPDFPPSNNTLWIERSVNGCIKAYIKFKNGSVKSLNFPSDLFENIGKNSTNREYFEEHNLIFNLTPDKIEWNGKYFLISLGGYSIIKYNGSFSILRMCEGYYCAGDTELIVPGSRYWVVVNILSGSPERQILIVDGEELRVISSTIVGFDRKIKIDTVTHGIPWIWIGGYGSGM